MFIVAVPPTKSTVPLYIKSACGPSINECTKWCVSFLSSNGWSILNEPLPFDTEPVTYKLPLIFTRYENVAIPVLPKTKAGVVKVEPPVAVEGINSKAPDIESL